MSKETPLRCNRCGRDYEEIARTKRNLYARIIVNAHLLDTPFTDEPRLSPWKLLIRDMGRLDDALTGRPRREVTG